MTRHKLPEATELICGPDSGLADPQRWVAQHLRSGRFPGMKVGRNWLMTDADIEAAIEACRNTIRETKPEPEPSTPPVTVFDGLSARCRARIRRTA